ncbi:MAG: GGDEF domain-containing protein [Chromatiales bacterium]|jgi:diguanylate cyclase (GGDEF)-like protein
MDTSVRSTAANLRLVESRISDKTAFNKAVSPIVDHELRLMEKLQTTLDIEQLISLFARESAALVKFDALHYQLESNNLSLSIGHEAKHQCVYGLKLENQQLGELVFQRKTRFRESELKNLEILLSALIYPLRNALQYQQAIDSAFTDVLTGAQNRAAMNQSLKREIELAKRQNNPLSVILLDADHFKQINDTHGHGYGDEVLKAIATVTQDTIRQSDLLFRYGGEEFLVLLGQTSIIGAQMLAERIRQRIESLDTIAGQRADVTVSLGVTCMNQEDDCESLFERADKALYQAKQSGRNQAVVFSAE